MAGYLYREEWDVLAVGCCEFVVLGKRAFPLGCLTDFRFCKLKHESYAVRNRLWLFLALKTGAAVAKLAKDSVEQHDYLVFDV
jgi:hypothetical protein